MCMEDRQRFTKHRPQQVRVIVEWVSWRSRILFIAIYIERDRLKTVTTMFDKTKYQNHGCFNSLFGD